MYYQGMENAAEENWRVLTSLFPDGWDRQAKETGAMERQRGIKVPDTLLRLFLLHVARGYSLRETSVLAEESGLCRRRNKTTAYPPVLSSKEPDRKSVV